MDPPVGRSGIQIVLGFMFFFFWEGIAKVGVTLCLGLDDIQLTAS